VIVEVLSDSTEGFDRGDKFKSYRNIPSLKEYLLVSQNENCIEQFYKDENGRWQFGEIVTSGSLTLRSINIEITIDDIYFNTESDSGQEDV
jgi:Uma2 family endonuclease